MTGKLAQLLPSLVTQANLAPSVHNIQPSRWQLHGEQLQLLGDTRRAIPVADPTMRDWRLSHGAQLEGMKLALEASGYDFSDLVVAPEVDLDKQSPLNPIARGAVVSKRGPVENAAAELELAYRRQSWRGGFGRADQLTRDALSQLARARPDCPVFSEPDDIRRVASLYDRASMHFLRDAEHREELLSWMRLSKSHPAYSRDGLNLAAMSLNGFEAWAASHVLGSLFRGLDAVGLAGLLLSESAKCSSAAAIVIMPRPIGEDPFETGRHFYRLWLDFERYGFKACPMSVLVDWDRARQDLETQLEIPSNLKICAVFRIGKPAVEPYYPRARLSAKELIV